MNSHFSLVKHFNDESGSKTNKLHNLQHFGSGPHKSNCIFSIAVLEQLCLFNVTGPRTRFHETWSSIPCISGIIVNDIRVVTWIRVYETINDILKYGGKKLC